MSSRLISIEDFETSKSSENSLFPITPSNCAIIFLFFKLAIRSPFLTFWLKFIGLSISYFSILNDCVRIGVAVPYVLIIFSKTLSCVVVTIIPGGGLLLNFF